MSSKTSVRTYYRALVLAAEHARRGVCLTLDVQATPSSLRACLAAVASGASRGVSQPVIAVGG